MHTSLIISPTIARRVAVESQRLAGPRPNPDAEGIMEVVNRLGCLQLDPINIVARSPLLVLWSRLGAYDPALLDTLLWQERRLFEYWAHAASIVLTEDYPIHQMLMRAQSMQSSSWYQRMSAWMEQNDALRISILNALRERGPLRSRDIEDTSEAAWQSTGWTNERNVSRMLDFLWLRGQILVARRVNSEKWWDLMDRCLPGWISYEPLPEHEVVRRAAQKSLRALGVATERDIAQHFTRNRYPDLGDILAELEAEGQIVRVRIQETGRELPGTWYIHADMIPTMEKLEATAWEPRTTLLSPFDNLICDRKRTERLFGFRLSERDLHPKKQTPLWILCDARPSW
jgi:uncharacterized protein YcaQ